MPKDKKSEIVESPLYNGAKEGYMYDYLRYRGLNPSQAAGLLGNLAVESYLNADQKQFRGTGYGLMQAEGLRKKNMLDHDYIYQFGSKLSPEEQQQLDYIIDKGIDLYTPGEWGNKNFKGARDARNAFLNTDNVLEASDIITNNFLRPGKPQIDKRREMAEYYMDKFSDPYEIGLLDYAKGGRIHIKPSRRGTFTAAAKRHGKSVQAFASQVMANPDRYTPAMRRKANFARNAAKWKHEDGGLIERVKSVYGDRALEVIRSLKK